MDYRAVGALKLSQPNSSGNSVGGAVNNWNVKLNSGERRQVNAVTVPY